MMGWSYIKINDEPVAVPPGAIAYKYADPTEDARWVYERDDLRDLKREGAPLEEGLGVSYEGRGYDEWIPRSDGKY